MEVMSKQPTPKAKMKPPNDPIESAAAMVKRLGDATDSHHPNALANDYDTVAPMLQTVLIVRAIDRLTAAVKAQEANTIALAKAIKSHEQMMEWCANNK
jgi:hypothetical protein